MAPLIEVGNEGFVHHIILFACYGGVEDKYHGTGHICRTPNMPDELKACNEIVFCWTVGAGVSLTTLHFVNDATIQDDICNMINVIFHEFIIIVIPSFFLFIIYKVLQVLDCSTLYIMLLMRLLIFDPCYLPELFDELLDKFNNGFSVADPLIKNFKFDTR